MAKRSQTNLVGLQATTSRMPLAYDGARRYHPSREYTRYTEGGHTSGQPGHGRARTGMVSRPGRATDVPAVAAPASRMCARLRARPRNNYYPAFGRRSASQIFIAESRPLPSASTPYSPRERGVQMRSLIGLARARTRYNYFPAFRRLQRLLQKSRSLPSASPPCPPTEATSGAAMRSLIGTGLCVCSQLLLSGVPATLLPKPRPLPSASTPYSPTEAIRGAAMRSPIGTSAPAITVVPLSPPLSACEFYSEKPHLLPSASPPCSSTKATSGAAMRYPQGWGGHSYDLTAGNAPQKQTQPAPQRGAMPRPKPASQGSAHTTSEAVRSEAIWRP